MSFVLFIWDVLPGYFIQDSFCSMPQETANHPSLLPNIPGMFPSPHGLEPFPCALSMSCHELSLQELSPAEFKWEAGLWILFSNISPCRLLLTNPCLWTDFPIKGQGSCSKRQHLPSALPHLSASPRVSHPAAGAHGRVQYPCFLRE